MMNLHELWYIILDGITAGWFYALPKFILFLKWRKTNSILDTHINEFKLNDNSRARPNIKTSCKSYKDSHYEDDMVVKLYNLIITIPIPLKQLYIGTEPGNIFTVSAHHVWLFIFKRIAFIKLINKLSRISANTSSGWYRTHSLKRLRQT